ncbi:hypothetical protein PBY51_021856 [Eleginops maclovinus]|uniref:Uncharacterized protein n=1 Tax=Eleginops maclovinus TaxID=56733 RepID=A0AAN7XFI6_ELEMC|nr:hypothetical protein PBY51_021856 [Eleginops maclovinus]
MHVRSPPHLSCSEGSPSGSQQPARLCLPIGMLGSGCVQCSVSAAKAGRRGTATAAPSISPVMASAEQPCSSFHQQHCA